jgi:hypothetical protein
LTVASHRTRRAVRLGIPGLIVGLLAFGALWRLGSSGRPQTTAAPAQKPAPLPTITAAADVAAPESVGRRTVLESVPIVSIPSPRTLWIGPPSARVFVVLDPDVKISHEARVTEGARVTLIGLVRRPPAADVAIRQWTIDAETARLLEAAGAYLHVTEVRPAG